MTQLQNQYHKSRNPEKRWIQLFSVLLLLLVGITTETYAQGNSQYVFASQGNYSESSDMSISWTLGDTYIKTQGIENLTLTQGFQQPDIQVKRIESSGIEDFNARMYPNPTTGELTLEIFEKSGPCKIEIYDSVGRLIKKLDSEESIVNIDLSPQHAGQYFIRLTNAEHSKLSLFEIIKL